MARRTSQSDQNLDDLLDVLCLVPWWMGPPLIFLVWWLLHDLVPTLATDYWPGRDHELAKPGIQLLTTMSVTFSPVIAGVVGLVWVVALLKKMGRSRRLERQTGIESIRSLSWREFELLLGEAFRRQRYMVEDTGGVADGGVDLILSRRGQVTLVQAKQWKARKVGVKIVRELFGVQISRQAHDAIVVTSGDYTREARQFAASNGVKLVDGPVLERMIADVQRSGRVQPTPKTRSSSTKTATAAANPRCPKCGKPMVQRVAQRGANAGQAFWGCSGYPSCRATRRVG
ncbi:restriction endonuclease [Mucisphaera calidilacus]|uniref:Restriction endonuclease n=1 Tax=Mucisphaera calidilacus TaxID=2527982 RepID=A0A518C087_9BACT|nr:restriction endonuclease [Mucisphaera calidilacus]QDU72632.1 Restriction endonuclease [Mucisphaera calidilacus]